MRRKGIHLGGSPSFVVTSSSTPGFLFDGHGLVSYAAFDDHYSFFPMSSKAIDAHRDELGSHVTGKDDPVGVRPAAADGACEGGRSGTRLAEATTKRGGRT